MCLRPMFRETRRQQPSLAGLKPGSARTMMELLTPCSSGRGGSACRAWVGSVAPILSPGDQEAFIKGKGIHLLISARNPGKKMNKR